MVSGLSRSLLAFAVVAAVVGPATAEARKPNRAAKRFDRMAKQAYVKKEWADAIAAFKLAYEADPLPKFAFNIGRCYEKAGKLDKAIEYLERYVEAAPDAEGQAEAQALIAIVRVKLKDSRSPVRVRSKPEGAIVRLTSKDHLAEGATPFYKWVPFGAYKIEVSKDGFVGVVQNEPILEGKEVVIDLELVAIKVAGPEPVAKPVPEAKPGAEDKPAPTPEVESEREAEAESEPEVVATAPETVPQEEADSGGGSLVPPIAAFGAGVAGLAGGVFFAGKSQEWEAHLDVLRGRGRANPVSPAEIDDSVSQRDTAAMLSYISYGVGGVALVTGALLIALGGDDGEETEAETAWWVVPTPDGLVVTVHRGW